MTYIPSFKVACASPGDYRTKRVDDDPFWELCLLLRLQCKKQKKEKSYSTKHAKHVPIKPYQLTRARTFMSQPHYFEAFAI